MILNLITLIITMLGGLRSIDVTCYDVQYQQFATITIPVHYGKSEGLVIEVPSTYSYVECEVGE